MKTNWRRCYSAILAAVVLVVGCASFFYPNQARAGTPDDAYTIERYHTENLGTQSTASTTYQDALTLTFTPPSTKNYLIMVSSWTNNTNNLYAAFAQLTIDGTSYSESVNKPVDTALNKQGFSAHKVISLDATAHTVKIQYRTENAAGTATIEHPVISIIEVTNYYNAEANAENTTTSTSYVNAVSLTFTPPAQADYLILVTANIASDTAGKSITAQWTQDATPDSEIEHPETLFASWSSTERENLTAASHTFNIQFHTANPATARIRNARVTAVLLTDLGTAQYAEAEAESKTTSITYVDKTTLSMTPTTRGDHLQISSALGRQESASYAFYSNINVDGTSEGETIFVPGSDRIYRSFMFLSKHNSPANITHTMKIQWRTNNSAPQSEVFIENANIVHFQVDTVESYNDSGHTTVDDLFSSGENTVYIWSHGLRPSGDTTYAVAYYDGSVTGGGQKIATDSGLTPTAYGNLSSQYLLNTDIGATAGTWHAVVFDEEFLPGGGPPTNYNDAVTTPGYVVVDSFESAAAAIPEFPTVIAAITVAGFCFVIYYWMRRKQVAYVQA